MAIRLRTQRDIVEFWNDNPGGFIFAGAGIIGLVGPLALRARTMPHGPQDWLEFLRDVQQALAETDNA